MSLLIDLTTFKLTPGGNDTGLSDAVLTQTLTLASAAVEAFVHRTFALTSYTEYYDSPGRPNLVLRQRPVTLVASISLDTTGYYGDGVNAFPATALLVAGVDYALRRDQPDNSSRSGLVVKLAGSGGNWGFYGLGYGVGWSRGTLTLGSGPPCWPAQLGAIKITYTAGFAVIPDAVQGAASAVAQWMISNLPYGGSGQVTGEGEGEASYSLGAIKSATSALAAVGELGSARQALAPYHNDLPIG